MILMEFKNHDELVAASKNAAEKWRLVPAPQRGEVIRQFGNELRNQKADLAKVITAEARKIVTEAEGEVQEAIDMCDFATGLSRQLYGLTMPSERPDHRLQELWQPIGVIGCITAFNFPMAVFAWNFCLASVCGNSIIWKPSPHSNGCADALKKAWDKVSGEHKNLVLVLKGGNEEAVALCKDSNIPLISATGSTQMGKELAPIVSARLGRTLLELGGNNAAILDTLARAYYESGDLTRAIKYQKKAVENAEKAKKARLNTVVKNVENKLKVIQNGKEGARVYRAAARNLHPNKATGNTESFKRLGKIYNNFKKRIG